MTRKAVYNPEADKRWREKNKEHRAYLNARGASRSFIRRHATLEDLDEIIALVEKRRVCYPKQLDRDNNPVEE